ncbi:MAG: hypothetical protein ACRDN8_17330 [Thermoleophilaceae bacterium]
MRSRRRLAIALASVLVAGGAGGVLGERTFALFSGQASNSSPGLTADADWIPPSASAAVIAKTAGGDGGYIRAGGTYYAYANVVDGGNPPSGVASVSADVGMGPVSLSSAGGPWTVEGVTYNYRSASQTLAAGTPPGTYPFTVSSTDSDTPANGQTQNGFNVVVDNTGASGSDVQTANGAATVGRPEPGDTVTFTYSEPIERISILPGWTSGTANVVVRINNGNPDRLQVWNSTNTIQLLLTNAAGLNLNRNDYVGANRTFGLTGTPSTMVRSGNSITITLGTQSGAGTTAAANGTMSWVPSASATDRAGNPTSTATVTESGAGDREF